MGVVERKELQRVSLLESDGAVRSTTLSRALLMVPTCETTWCTRGGGGGGGTEDIIFINAAFKGRFTPLD